MFEKFLYWLEDDLPGLLFDVAAIVGFVLLAPVWVALWLLWLFVFRKKGKGK